jgi:L-fuconolactonase
MIDAHHHFWKFNSEDFPWISEDMAILRRDFLLPELENDLDLCGIDQVISVQARCSDEENQFLLNQANTSDHLVAAVIGWAPLTSSSLRTFLDPYIYNPLFKGVREIIKHTPTEQFLDNPDFDHGIRELTQHNLTFDLFVSADQLPATIAFADKHPNQRFVLNHCGCPDILENFSPEAHSTWARNIRELARRPHVYCKLSGLYTKQQQASSRWNPDPIRPYFDTILKAFTPQRLMYASGWPTCLLHTNYPIWINTVDNLIHSLSTDEKLAIYATTATDFYQL